MSINVGISETPELKPKILVIGVGGAGGNAVNNMIQSKLDGVEFWVANTDAQALSNSLVPEDHRIQLGMQSTRGLGAGSHPEIGARAAEESLSELQTVLESANMCFITAGMGGGTGTGAAPMIAKLARDMGILTVGVVTKPFQFEGARRMRVAEAGLNEMQDYVDTLIIIPNQNLFRIANEKTTFADAFGMADEVLHSGIRSVTDLITYPGIVNLDFADIKTIMFESGKAMMGTGEAEGDNRAIQAAENAISNPLLDIQSMKGAAGVLINISGGYDMTLYELDEAANRIKDEVATETNIIVGSAFNEGLDGKIRVAVVATGIDQELKSEFTNSQTELELNNQSAIQSSEPEEEQENTSEEESIEDTNESQAQTSIQFNNDKADQEEEKEEESMPQENLFDINPQKDLLNKDNFAGFDNVNQQEPVNNNPEDANKKNDIFDIPAFLRRKIGKK